jgi:putative membrane protein
VSLLGEKISGSSNDHAAALPVSILNMPTISRMAMEKTMRLITRGLAAGRVKTHCSGSENIPSQGPALIVARHYHHLYDGLALFAALRRPFHIVVTLDWVTNRPAQYFMETITRIARWPVVLRSDALALGARNTTGLFSQNDVLRYQRKALRQAIELLVEGRILVIFPEAYPNIDPHYTPKKSSDEFLAFRPGLANIVAAAEKRLESPIPIIPAGLRYTTEKPWTAHLRFGAAIYRRSFLTARDLIAHLEEDVKQLSAAGTIK